LVVFASPSKNYAAAFGAQRTNEEFRVGAHSDRPGRITKDNITNVSIDTDTRKNLSTPFSLYKIRNTDFKGVSYSGDIEVISSNAHPVIKEYRYNNFEQAAKNLGIRIQRKDYNPRSMQLQNTLQIPSRLRNLAQEPRSISLGNMSHVTKNNRLGVKYDAYNMSAFEQGRNPHLYVVGYSGSGKTTVSQDIAKRMKRQYISADDLYEREMKRLYPNANLNQHGVWESIPLSVQDKIDKRVKRSILNISKPSVIDGVNLPTDKFSKNTSDHNNNIYCCNTYNSEIEELEYYGRVVTDMDIRSGV